jgi:apolipoprotein N-acyltransferase
MVGLALFFYTLAEQGKNILKAGLLGLLFGTATGCAGTAWFLETLPLDFLGIQNGAVQIVAVTMTWLYVGLSLGAPISITAVALNALGRSAIYPLAAALIWMLSEIARMWSFAVTTWAPSSLFGPHFSAAAIGYAVTENPTFLQLAHPFGLDALNVAAAFIAGQLAMIPRLFSADRRVIPAALQALATVVIMVIPKTLDRSASSSNSSASLRFALISENIPSVRELESHEVVKELLIRAAQAQPAVDVILLPEEFSLTSIFWSRDEAAAFIKQYFGSRDVLIAHSRNELFPAEETNSFTDPKKLVYDSTTSGEVGRYVKLLLMPLGEYAPAFTKTFFSAIDDADLQMYLDEVVQLPPPGRDVAGITYRNVTIGGLLCSDILSPHLYRRLARNHRPDVLINLANQFWFHGSNLLHYKTIQMARVHAVQNRLPFLMANNTAPSFALNSAGSVIAQSEWGSRAVLIIDVAIKART